MKTYIYIEVIAKTENYNLIYLLCSYTDKIPHSWKRYCVYQDNLSIKKKFNYLFDLKSNQSEHVGVFMVK